MTHHLPRALPTLSGLLLVAAPLAAQAPLWGDDLIHKVDSLAAATLATGRVAGMSIAVSQRDDVLIVQGYGLADVELDVPADPQTVYRIGSVTKQFTAAAIMRLVEAGAVDLDAPITTYLPDFPTQGHTVTVRHLLTHTSGIASYTSLAAFPPKMPLPLTDDELLALFQDEPFDFPPGEQYRYSNSGYYLLGMIVQAVSGMPYREYMEQEVFAPLGLHHTRYCDERRILPGRAEGYAVAEGALVNDAPLSMNQPGAAGALCSSAFDLLAWARDLREGEAVSAESYRLMTTAAVLNDGDTTGYGFGLGLGHLEDHPMVGHGGGINGFASSVAYYPDADLDVVVLVNTEGPTADQVARTIARWALGLPVAPPVRDLQLTASELARYVGTYRLGPDVDLEIYIRGTRLFSRATGQRAVRLRAQGDHVFIPTFDDAVRIVFDVEEGRAASLELHQGGVRRAPRVD